MSLQETLKSMIQSCRKKSFSVYLHRCWDKWVFQKEWVVKSGRCTFTKTSRCSDAGESHIRVDRGYVRGDEMEQQV